MANTNAIKYVSFVDMLGFKDLVQRSTQEQACKTVEDFSSLFYSTWQELNYQEDNKICGFIVSDCAIIYTSSDSPEELDLILRLLLRIFPESIYKNGIMLRASITKGNFEAIPSTDIKNLGKRLIVGKAYVDAYMLESQFKGSQIIFGEDVVRDIEEINDSDYTIKNISREDSANEKYFSLQWASVDEFVKDENIKCFIDLAVKSNWNSHYYSTIHLFVKDISNQKKKKDIFDKIWSIIASCDSLSKSNTDNFITKAFVPEVDFHFKRMIAKYLRDSVDKSLGIIRNKSEV